MNEASGACANWDESTSVWGHRPSKRLIRGSDFVKSTGSAAASGLDKVDQTILKRLQEDGRISMAQLARELHISVTPTVERVRRLEKAGYIVGYRADLSPTHLGQNLLAYVQVALDRTTPEVFDRFRTAMEVLEFVQEANMVAGGFDYLLKIRVRDMKEYRNVLSSHIACIKGVQQTHTYFVMEEVKSSSKVRVPTR
jgi:Lrp/AsnC family transcriptional regulator, leucine-responsive regulatory protein